MACSIIKPVRIIIRQAYPDEWDDAMSLAWRVFKQFVAKDYTPEGVGSFLDFISDSELKHMFEKGEFHLFGAYGNGQMIGMISLRNRTHISLLFIDAPYHKKGIGRQLIQYVERYVMSADEGSLITVNSSPYAVDFYHRVGFRDTGVKQCSDGIWYVPMEKKLGRLSGMEVIRNGSGVHHKQKFDTTDI